MHANRDTVGISEIKFAQIPVQALLLAVLIHAFHAALEDRIETFNRVRVEAAAHVFVHAVIDGTV
jgi:hypothetical protein